MAHAEAREVIDDACLAQMRRTRRRVAQIVASTSVTRSREHVGEVLALAVDQVVDDDDAVAARGELTHQLGADEPGAAGDHHVRPDR